MNHTLSQKLCRSAGIAPDVARFLAEQGLKPEMVKASLAQYRSDVAKRRAVSFRGWLSGLVGAKAARKFIKAGGKRVRKFAHPASIETPNKSRRLARATAQRRLASSWDEVIAELNEENRRGHA